MEPFIALDFETANNSRASACEVSLVRFENGLPTNAFTTLLRPPPETGAFIHTKLHGIKERDCVDAPSLPEVLPAIVDFIGALPVLCHNAGFDFSVLRTTLDHHGVDYPEVKYGCTLAMSRSALRNDSAIVQYSLPRVCWHLDIPFHETHRAEADAEGCGNVAAKLCDRSECDTLSELADTHGVTFGMLGPYLDERCRGRGAVRRNPEVHREALIESMMSRLGVTTLDPGGELAGKVVVVTGALQSLSRKEAESILEECGAIVSGSVTRKTDILIEGQQTSSQVRDGVSNKQAKCMELKAKGHPIEVMDERMFLENLGD